MSRAKRSDRDTPGSQRCLPSFAEWSNTRPQHAHGRAGVNRYIKTVERDFA